MFNISSRKMSLTALALGIALVTAGNAMAAAPSFSTHKATAQNHSPTRSAANKVRAPGGGLKEKICKTTVNPDGSKCTFCYYTTQPGSGTTNCIKAPTSNN